MGRSGAGKSTLVNLLLRLHELEGGRITIDGQDITAVTQHSLRGQIGMVTQDTSLLHRSIQENILYGKPAASEEDLVAASRQAHAHDFIQSLEDKDGNRGYDAQVGERGIKLSGASASSSACPGTAQGRPHTGAGRSHFGAGLRSGGRHSGKPVPVDGRQNGDRHRPSPLHHRRHGPPGGA
ncbi:ATP-binding cassette domain-containing protein [Oceanimonas sp. NS1]|nr:ATP-binding cassette domain-containing protein [Oceanimonas sp. NS1]